MTNRKYLLMMSLGVVCTTFSFGCKKSNNKPNNNRSDPTPESQDSPNFEDIVFADPESLVLDNEMDPSQVVEIGACVEMTLGLVAKDPNAPTIANHDITANLVNSGDSGVFFEDSDCTKVGTSVKMPKDEGIAVFYFKAAKKGTFALTANDTSTPALKPGSSQVSIGTPSKIVLSSDKTTVAAGTCGMMSASVQDDNGHSVILARDVELTLASTTKTMEFFYEQNCQGKAASKFLVDVSLGSVILFFKDMTTGAATVTADAPSDRGIAQGKISVQINTK